MFNKDIGIDLGTANVLIYIKGQGIVLNEPSVVEIDADTKRPLAVGSEAHEMLGRTPGKVKAIKPMKDGVIADYDTTEVMLNYFIKKINGKSFFSRPRILICCPSNITQVEKNAIKEAAERTGAKKVFLEEEPKVAAIGAGMDISKPSGNMVIDIGGGTTDIAILSLGGIVNSASIRIAGNAFDNDIVKYIKNKYKLLVGERTAEDIKISIGTVFPGSRNEKMEVRGRDLVTGLPHTITLTSDEVDNLRDYVLGRASDLGSIKHAVLSGYLSDADFSFLAALASAYQLASLDMTNLQSTYSYRFQGCSQFREVKYSRYWNSTGFYLFEECANITKVEFPTNIIGGGYLKLDGGTFRGCTSLEEIRIPSTVQSLGSQCFCLCI